MVNINYLILPDTPLAEALRQAIVRYFVVQNFSKIARIKL